MRNNRGGYESGDVVIEPKDVPVPVGPAPGAVRMSDHERMDEDPLHCTCGQRFVHEGARNIHVGQKKRHEAMRQQGNIPVNPNGEDVPTVDGTMITRPL